MLYILTVTTLYVFYLIQQYKNNNNTSQFEY